MTAPADFLSRARRAIEEATNRKAKGFPAPLPWYASGERNMIWADDGDAITGPEPYFERPVANLIVLAVNALPALLDVYEAAKKLISAEVEYEESDDDKNDRELHARTLEARAHLRSRLARLETRGKEVAP